MIGVRRLAGLGLLAALLVLLLSPGLYRMVASVLFSGETEVIYQRRTMVNLFLEHLVLALGATAGAVVVGVAAGVLVTRPIAATLRPLVQDLAALAQTVPPVAVLALSVPLLGYGGAPTVAALFFYSVLPVLRNTIAGIEQVDPIVVEASVGMGMTPSQRLRWSELPLASPVILAGMRTAAIINIGTATIGATIGAGGLGVVIIAGLVRDNLAYIVAGAATAAVLALIVDWFFETISTGLYKHRVEEATP
jgi:osmoprotectant transport system permease protein